MIDKPNTSVGLSGAFSPLAKAVIDSMTEGVVVFDAQGRLLYANAAARRVVDGQNGDLRQRLQTIGARFAALRNGSQQIGEAAILPSAGAFTLADRERQAITETLQDTSGKLAETARRLASGDSCLIPQEVRTYEEWRQYVYRALRAAVEGLLREADEVRDLAAKVEPELRKLNLGPVEIRNLDGKVVTQ